MNADAQCADESLPDREREDSVIVSLTFHTCLDGVRQLIADIEEPDDKGNKNGI